MFCLRSRHCRIICTALLRLWHPSPVWWNKLRFTHRTGALVTQRQIHHLKILPQPGWQPKNARSLDLPDQVAHSSITQGPWATVSNFNTLWGGALWIWWVFELPGPWKFYRLLVSYEPPSSLQKGMLEFRGNHYRISRKEMGCMGVDSKGSKRLFWPTW